MFFPGMPELLNIARSGRVVRIEFARPEKKNALNRSMYEALASTMEEAAADREVTVVVFFGKGNLFTSGNDIADFAANPPTSEEDAVFRFLQALATSPQILVAAVEGVAIGIGATMLLHCDFVVAAESAQFSFPFVNLGLVPEAGSSLLLPALAGYQRAAELVLLGEPFDATGAQSLGLLSRIVPDGQAKAEADRLVQNLLQKPPEALLAAKRLLKANCPQIVQRIREEARIFLDRLTSEEARTAFARFLKRPMTADLRELPPSEPARPLAEEVEALSCDGLGIHYLWNDGSTQRYRAATPDGRQWVIKLRVTQTRRTQAKAALLRYLRQQPAMDPLEEVIQDQDPGL
jgi:enoyl-CoA hydratase/carnithine racemase